MVARTSVPYPFNTRQYARLLVLRSRVQDHPARGSAEHGGAAEGAGGGAHVAEDRLDAFGPTLYRSAQE